MKRKFLEKFDGSKELTNEDNFTLFLSSFDRASRLKSEDEVSKEVFLKFISNQTLNWKSQEISKLTKIFNLIDTKFDNFQLRFPEEISLIKTTGREEGNAAYCRGNSIILPQSLLNSSQQLENLIIHEHFHIFTRNNNSVKEKLYEIIGFYECATLIFPKELTKFKITNPDAPLNDHYIEVKIQNNLFKLIPIIFSNESYNYKKKGEFFDYLEFRLLGVNIKENNSIPIYKGGNPLLFKPEKSPDFFQKIGFNTNYIIHPEEILAENFVLMINDVKNLNTPEVIDKMRKILKSKF